MAAAADIEVEVVIVVVVVIEVAIPESTFVPKTGEIQQTSPVFRQSICRNT